MEAHEGGATVGRAGPLLRGVLDAQAAPDGEADELQRAVHALDARGPVEQPHGRRSVDHVGLIETAREPEVVRGERLCEDAFLLQQAGLVDLAHARASAPSTARAASRPACAATPIGPASLSTAEAANST